MKLRYMVEYALRDRDTNPHYEPIGVWVQGPGPGLDTLYALCGDKLYKRKVLAKAAPSFQPPLPTKQNGG